MHLLFCEHFMDISSFLPGGDPPSLSICNSFGMCSLCKGYSRKKYLGGEGGGGGRRQTIYFSMGGRCGHFSNYMGHWCLKESDYMGGWVL